GKVASCRGARNRDNQRTRLPGTRCASCQLQDSSCRARDCPPSVVQTSPASGLRDWRLQREFRRALCRLLVPDTTPPVTPVPDPATHSCPRCRRKSPRQLCSCSPQPFLGSVRPVPAAGRMSGLRFRSHSQGQNLHLQPPRLLSLLVL